MADLSLQEQVLLLCLDDKTGKFDEVWVDYALDAAAFVELMLMGRVRLNDEDGRIAAIEDASPTGDALLDIPLTRLAETENPGPLDEWIGEFYRGKPSARQALTERLVEKNILKKEEGRILWIFPQTRYPTQMPEPEQALREQIRAAVAGGAPVDRRLAALISLLRGSDALDRLFTEAERQQYAGRIRQISESDPVARAGGAAVAEAVKDAIAVVGGAAGAA